MGQAGTRGRSTWAAKFAGLFQEAGPRSPGQPRAEGRGFPATGLRIAGSIPRLVPSPGPTPPGPAPPLICHPTWSRLTCSARGRLRLVRPVHRNAPPLGGSGGRRPRRKREGGAPGSVTSQRDGPGLRHGGDVRDCGVIQGGGARRPGWSGARPVTSGAGSGRALVRRRKEPAQAHGRRDAGRSSRRAPRLPAHSSPLAGGTGSKWPRPALGRLGCSCSC